MLHRLMKAHGLVAFCLWMDKMMGCAEIMHHAHSCAQRTHVFDRTGLLTGVSKDEAVPSTLLLLC